MDIKKIHEVLNDIYDKAENFNKELMEFGYKTNLASYNNHYINISGCYYKQKYYMPVISIEDKGDICFNINSIEYEFYVTKEQIDFIDLDKLIDRYKNELGIYEYDNCDVDIYKLGDKREDVLNKVRKSLDNKFGISINCSSFSNEEIIKHFAKVCTLLNK